MEKRMDTILPIMDVQHDCILSKQGDITVVFQVELPELFTMSDQEYEAFHQSWLKAVKVLPKFSVFHKQQCFDTFFFLGVQTISFTDVKGIESNRILFIIGKIVTANHITESFVTMPNIHQYDMSPLLIITSYHVVGKKGF